MANTKTHTKLPGPEIVYLHYLDRVYGRESRELADRVCLLIHHGWMPSVIALSFSIFAHKLTTMMLEYTQYELPYFEVGGKKNTQPQKEKNPTPVTNELLANQDPPLPRGGYKMYYSDAQINTVRGVARNARKATATTPPGHKYYQATLKLDVLIQDAIRRGLTRSEISRLCGLSRVTITLRMRHYDQDTLKEFEREGAELRARGAIPGKDGVPYPHQINRYTGEGVDN